MTVGDINALMQAEIPGLTTKKEVFRQINRVISEINPVYEGMLANEIGLKNVSGDITAQTGYTWDETTRILTLPDGCKKLLKVFINDIELEPNGLEFAQDSDNSDEEIYAIVALNQIYIPSGLLDTEDDELEIVMLKDIPTVTSSANDTEVDIPAQLQSLLYNGIRTYLYSMEKYYNKVQLELSIAAYEKGKDQVNNLETKRMPNTNYQRDYTV